MERSIRLQIAEVQLAVRQLKHELAEAVASTEKATIEAAGGIKAIPGAEAERKQTLAHAVADSPICRKLQRDIIGAEGTLLRLEAAQADQQDAAQRERWQVRARLCDALEALAMAQPAGFFSGAEVEQAAEHIFDTMVSATAKNGLDAAAEAATAPGVLYNTGRHVVAVRGVSPLAAAIPAMDRYMETSNAIKPITSQIEDIEPRGRTGVQTYHAEAARRAGHDQDAWNTAQREADELFGD